MDINILIKLLKEEKQPFYKRAKYLFKAKNILQIYNTEIRRIENRMIKEQAKNNINKSIGG